MIYKPTVRLELDVPNWGATPGTAQTVKYQVRPLAVKWTKNHHLAADEMTVTIGYMEGGIDPRLLKHARADMWMWDDVHQTFDAEDHHRFAGICKKASRKLAANGWVVDLTFHDYTSMFLAMKPFPTAGIPEWTDTLRTAWTKICDHVGAVDPNNEQKIISSVSALREAITFVPSELGERTLGEATIGRFLAMAKPQPKRYSDAWSVWQWLCGMLGLVSFMDKAHVIVTMSSELYDVDRAPMLIYGHNIEEFEENADPDTSNKGILLKSFDPLKGVLLEARYPDPSDERIKKSRASAARAAKEGRDLSLNDTSTEYMEFERHDIHDQQMLDFAARQAYEEYSRQELKGTIKTSEMLLPRRVAQGDPLGFDAPIDTLSLRSGDPIHVGMDDKTRDGLKHVQSEDAAIQYLTERCGYLPEVASLLVLGLGDRALANPTFHVETLTVDLADSKFEIDITYHNKIIVDA